MEIGELIRDGLASTKRVFDRTLDGLTSAELEWQPRSDANSIGLILFHSIRAEDSSVHMLDGKHQLWESEKWYQKFHKELSDGGATYRSMLVRYHTCAVSSVGWTSKRRQWGEQQQ
jgi:hypothetical protein